MYCLHCCPSRSPAQHCPSCRRQENPTGGLIGAKSWAPVRSQGLRHDINEFIIFCIIFYLLNQISDHGSISMLLFTMGRNTAMPSNQDLPSWKMGKPNLSVSPHPLLLGLQPHGAYPYMLGMVPPPQLCWKSLNFSSFFTWQKELIIPSLED